MIYFLHAAIKTQLNYTPCALNILTYKILWHNQYLHFMFILLGCVLPGPIGDKGEKGTEGMKGMKGETGPKGMAGERGDNGTSHFLTAVCSKRLCHTFYMCMACSHIYICI